MLETNSITIFVCFFLDYEILSLVTLVELKEVFVTSTGDFSTVSNTLNGIIRAQAIQKLVN